MDLLLNTWLPYQTLTARLWGRTGFYQSSGAYGFRDQLQDALAAARWSRPDLRARAPARAPPRTSSTRATCCTGGTRRRGAACARASPTTCCGCRYVTARYVAATGDAAVLDERVPFLDGDAAGRRRGRALRRVPGLGRTRPTCSSTAAARVRRGLTAGAHGLPLIGTGDWNDGMNRVGRRGPRRERVARLVRCRRPRATSPTLLRAARDDRRGAAAGARGRERAARRRRGTALGRRAGTCAPSTTTARRSARRANAECRIDSIAQAGRCCRARRGRDRADRAGDRPSERAGAGWDDRLVAAADAAVRRHHRRPRLHQGLPAGRPRERRPVHARGGVARRGRRAEAGDGDTAHRLFDLLNPIRRTADAAGVAHYLVEPYVLAADVYSRPPHVGRGGWTWYTGSSAWLYRCGLEAILGLSWEGDTLRVRPRLPGPGTGSSRPR